MRFLYVLHYCMEMSVTNMPFVLGIVRNISLSTSAMLARTRRDAVCMARLPPHEEVSAAYKKMNPDTK